MIDLPRIPPLYIKHQEGQPLTMGERFLVYVVGPVTRALSGFAWRVRVTSAMRERCVGYALRGGAEGGWNLTHEAERIAEYIAKGKV